MKKLQFWCVLASFLCALGLSSCSKDEDEPQVVPSIENIKGMWALNTYRIVFGPSENNREKEWYLGCTQQWKWLLSLEW